MIEKIPMVYWLRKIIFFKNNPPSVDYMMLRREIPLHNLMMRTQAIFLFSRATFAQSPLGVAFPGSPPALSARSLSSNGTRF